MENGEAASVGKVEIKCASSLVSVPSPTMSEHKDVKKEEKDRKKKEDKENKKKEEKEHKKKDDHHHEDDKKGEESDEEPTISQDIVVTKYNMAADIVNAVMKDLLGKSVPGQSVGEMIDLGDKELSERTSKVFKKEKDVKKGVAFPVCVSVNHCICHFSPLRSDPDTQLKEGDVVKIDLGAHIDGYIATLAHTTVVGASADNKVKGKKADAILAAYTGMEAAIRMLRPGQHKNMDITDTIQKVVTAFDCKPIENMLSHQLTRNKIDGVKQIIQNPGEKQRQEMEKCEVGQHEVYAIDVLVSTGEGKARDMDSRTTVYKKNDDIVYSLKMKASRTFFSEADKRFGPMPFTLRHFDEETKAKMGVVECERHGLMKAYPVLWERDGESVAQFKSTVLVMPNGLLKIAGLPLDTTLIDSDKRVEDPEMVKLLQSSLKPSKKKKKAGSEDKGAPKPPAEQNGDAPLAAPVKA